MVNEVMGKLLFTLYFWVKAHIFSTHVLKNIHGINKYDPGKIYFPKLNKHSKIIFINLFIIKNLNDLMNENVIKLYTIL